VHNLNPETSQILSLKDYTSTSKNVTVILRALNTCPYTLNLGPQALRYQSWTLNSKAETSSPEP